jgi:hypothetical protein
MTDSTARRSAQPESGGAWGVGSRIGWVQLLENLRELSAGHDLRDGLWNRAASEQELARVEPGDPDLDA